ncbi:2-succinyl-5-enolpyruvyl-6-hydroxy-3-cyclohexene-1-carboxylate synthase [Cellulophaga baltica]|uniref:2-succinyl-5-enolpyruvyl-6-hydroxy-3- cyclohexene-1-carboxylate synthase n=1 Tax=Cellulophaga TaxID=104264 RepID=UPI001C07E10B|nr:MULTISPECIES: thiamine pyrophosphate-binding protein [Cellulophaga]MBU2996097.1 2-succinyl-5-enolpyruvyl-6-hydroxy-3-cyclohexene-1-carboxylate synthase [Cellulophaga baltica]MDO6767492.1 thiamine pyrophosphate-binding protein [Cellulophaga sp. 1_MG-2023]
MKYSTIPTAQTVAYYCKKYGVKDIVISPGSRNAPLTISFTEDSFFTCHSIVDERCAAFFALGMAQNQQKPVAIVCTSGSALLNYYPAIAEAFYSDIPVIVISADRPSYKVDIGDGQTIRQEYLLEKHIGYSSNLKLDVSHATQTIKNQSDLIDETIAIEKQQEFVQQFNASELNKAFQTTLKRKAPVHINVPFEEPLYNTVAVADKQLKLVESIIEENEIEQLSDYIEVWNCAKRKLVLVGVNTPNAVEQKYLNVLANDPSVIVLTETTSNLHHNNFFASIDSLIAPIEKSENKEKLFNQLQPDILLTFGGLIVSKKIKNFLRTYKPKQHWHVDDKKGYDTFFSLSHHFKTPVNQFFKLFLNDEKSVESTYFLFWNKVRNHYENRRKAYLNTIPFSDMLAFSRVATSIPENYQLHLANSSTVRYAQLFDIHESLEVYCNRGTSGIDGSTSTAVGASIYNETPTLLITGDLSFLYDSNGLWNTAIRSDFRIIVMNNDGGGIFRILPGQEDTHNFETYFETRHSVSIKALSETYNFEHKLVSNETELENALNNFYKQSLKPKILEIKTPRIINNKILLSYFDFIS